MPIDYAAISENHDYEAMLVRVTRGIIASLYDDPTHFIFELLQNAEDALGRRVGKGSRAVSFELKPNGLRVSHFGKPFDEANVKAICSVGESSKEEDLTAIGKFGIGFKSVYSLTNRPEIHSGDEHFAIESFVHPVAIEPLPVSSTETVFWLPFKADIGDTAEEIKKALQDLPPTTLLFLRQISEIRWSVEGGACGSYSRTSKKIDASIRESTIRRSRDGVKLPPEKWLVCSRPVKHQSKPVGSAEIAFRLVSGDAGALVVQPIADSRLIAYFPTIVPAKLGFLIQAPFQTTPSRDNIPAKEPWNHYLVSELAQLLATSLVRLRDMGVLSLELLSALPISRLDFPAGSMLAPLYDATFAALRDKPLLPASNGTWVSARSALLARGEELRKLLRTPQLVAMFDGARSKKWLSDRLTLNRFPVLHRYLVGTQNVSEVTPTDCLPKWTKPFLEAQTDGWISELYAFLLSQPALMRETTFRARPWVRLEDRSHRAAFAGDQPLAFLPMRDRDSGFPSVRRNLLRSKPAAEFLSKLGLTEPDPVDDVIAHVLPRYAPSPVASDLQTYAADFDRILAAVKTDSTKQLEKLSSAVRDKKIVFTRDGLGQKFWTVPSNAYLQTASLRALFDGVKDVLLVDDEQACLKGDSARSLLRRFGASTYLDTFAVDSLSSQERYNLRGGRGTDGSVYDRDIRGLAGVLALVAKLPAEEAHERCKVLWDALRDLVRDSRETVLYGTYTWNYYGSKSAPILAHFVKRLREARWIPNEEGKLVKPVEAVFERIPGGWTENASLQKALGFKPPLMEILAKEMGVEPEMLSLLTQKGIKTKAQLMEKLGLTDEPPITDDVGEDEGVTDNTEQGDGAAGSGVAGSGSRGESGGASRGAGGGHSSSGGSGSSSGIGTSGSSTNNSHAGRREFFSYLKTHPVEVEEDEFSDSETHEERMRVESVAIDHILEREPDLHRTPPGNRGYDLFGKDDEDHLNRWIEVKAMVGTLANHPVGMSKAQFETAQEKKTRYWLYIVELATSKEPRILKIQDPAGNARTFTFDEGWREIALVSQVNLDTGEVLEEGSRL